MITRWKISIEMRDTSQLKKLEKACNLLRFCFTIAFLGVKVKVAGLTQKWQITSFSDSEFSGYLSVQTKIKVTKTPPEFNQFKGKVIKIKLS